MLKKFGMVSVGVTAGLLAIAPMASASEGGHHGGGQEGTGNIQCASDGDFEGRQGAESTQEGGLAEASSIIQTGPALSGNSGQLLSCNSFLNDNLNDNNLSIGGLGSSIDD